MHDELNTTSIISAGQVAAVVAAEALAAGAEASAVVAAAGRTVRTGQALK